jgi:hypothetical protein
MVEVIFLRKHFQLYFEIEETGADANIVVPVSCLLVVITAPIDMWAHC